MEIALSAAIGVLVAAAAYLLLARDLPRGLIGFVLLGTAANLVIFAAGRIGTMTPPLVEPGATALAAGAANPLPQALVLTAIVIGFGLTAFALVLVMRAHAAFGSARSEDMDAAEPPACTEAAPAPPETGFVRQPARAPARPLREVV
ncbi:cation:proton antiporter [Roseomonas alkaliterrae]|uniref:Multisubunit Na+/H+ antiporter MnhC subunit n=1 Tax=Neoroseomonas alkaliterrae TaxID=1452450 RepID=A0A840XV98_9PROT|nr:NADH-quinone oxidoreductase subunit K [Neoroseomonas alkaliterrae]MBB5688067.1 multisubunit Na+/H+ antiporter MnhC subunit [Neoroseomonas alkaliterrae]MBR0674940.1 cation:proton antiporter [Neoroseomonas alkaliterrae]